MSSAELTRAWHAAVAAKPADWTMQGLRCASTGLAAELRSERWVAEACGPRNECVRIEADTPEAALLQLTVRLKRSGR